MDDSDEAVPSSHIHEGLEFNSHHDPSDIASFMELESSFTCIENDDYNVQEEERHLDAQLSIEKDAELGSIGLSSSKDQNIPSSQDIFESQSLNFMSESNVEDEILSPAAKSCIPETPTEIEEKLDKKDCVEEQPIAKASLQNVKSKEEESKLHPDMSVNTPHVFSSDRENLETCSSTSDGDGRVSVDYDYIVKSGGTVISPKNKKTCVSKNVTFEDSAELKNTSISKPLAGTAYTEDSDIEIIEEGDKSIEVIYNKNEHKTEHNLSDNGSSQDLSLFLTNSTQSQLTALNQDIANNTSLNVNVGSQSLLRATDSDDICQNEAFNNSEDKQFEKDVGSMGATQLEKICIPANLTQPDIEPLLCYPIKKLKQKPHSPETKPTSDLSITSTAHSSQNIFNDSQLPYLKTQSQNSSYDSQVAASCDTLSTVHTKTTAVDSSESNFSMLISTNSCQSTSLTSTKDTSLKSTGESTAISHDIKIAQSFSPFSSQKRKLSAKSSSLFNVHSLDSNNKESKILADETDSETENNYSNKKLKLQKNSLNLDTGKQPLEVSAQCELSGSQSSTACLDENKQDHISNSGRKILYDNVNLYSLNTVDELQKKGWKKILSIDAYKDPESNEVMYSVEGILLNQNELFSTLQSYSKQKVSDESPSYGSISSGYLGDKSSTSSSSISRRETLLSTVSHMSLESVIMLSPPKKVMLKKRSIKKKPTPPVIVIPDETKIEENLEKLPVIMSDAVELPHSVSDELLTSLSLDVMDRLKTSQSTITEEEEEMLLNDGLSTEKQLSEIKRKVREVELAKGMLVFAQYQDKRFYSAVIMEEDGCDRWNVIYTQDGYSRSVRNVYILPTDVLPRGYPCIVLNEKFSASGIVKGHAKLGDNTTLLHIVETDTGESFCVSHANLALTEAQAEILLHARLSFRNLLTSPGGSISLDNLVESRKRRVITSPLILHCKRPVAKFDTSSVTEGNNVTEAEGSHTHHSSISTTLDTISVQSVSQVPKARRKLEIIQKTNKLTSVQEETESESSVSTFTPPRRRGSKRSSGSFRDSRTSKATPDKLAVTPIIETPVRGTKRRGRPPGQHSKTKVLKPKTEDDYGPIPSQDSTIFEGYTILLTSFSNSASNEELSESEGVIPMNRAHIKKQFLCGGGKILDTYAEAALLMSEFSSSSHDNCSNNLSKKLIIPPVILISDNFCRTGMFIQCLAANFPIVFYKWIEDSCRQDKCCDWTFYMLPLGKDPGTGDYIEQLPYSDKNKVGILSDLNIFLASSSDINFGDFWLPVLTAVKGSVKRLSGNNAPLNKLLDKSTNIVLADSSIPAAERRRADHLKVPVVSTEWLIQSLISGKKLPFDSPLYRHDIS